MPIYEIWQGMLKRCENPKSKAYQNYGARGVKVCERWRRFENFFADMGERPSRRHRLDRRDPNGDYEPLNVRWATRLQDGHNRRAPKNKQTSRYRGVDLHPKGWRARITINKKVTTIGTYHTEKEAAHAYDAAALPHGFPLNFGD